MIFRRNKFNAKKASCDGHSFASGLERDVYAMLKLMKLAGELSEVQPQDHVYMTKARILLIPDFKVTLPNGDAEWHEAKGIEMPEWRIKRRLWKAGYGPGKLSVWKRRGKGIFLSEVIIPGECGE